jgi:hypothetical protein
MGLGMEDLLERSPGKGQLRACQSVQRRLILFQALRSWYLINNGQRFSLHFDDHHKRKEFEFNVDDGEEVLISGKLEVDRWRETVSRRPPDPFLPREHVLLIIHVGTFDRAKK